MLHPCFLFEGHQAGRINWSGAKNRLKHTFLGSTTNRVVRYAPCPVLAVRGSKHKTFGRAQKPMAIRCIVLATDFSDNSMKAFPIAQSLAAAFGACNALMHDARGRAISRLLAELPLRPLKSAIGE